MENFNNGGGNRYDNRYDIDFFYNLWYNGGKYLRKGVECVIIIRDETMNQSFSFVATREGYMMADAKIQEIVGMGHKVGGDVAKVRAYVG